MNLYVADLHFGHKSVINFDKRPFSDVEEMDRVLIELWNSRVSKDDDVYVVGDFAYRNEKPHSWYLKQLKGKKHLIIGNHDRKLLEDTEAVKYFDSVQHYAEIVDGDKKIVLFHYPIAEWDGFFGDTWHIFGHYHNSTNSSYQYMKQLDRALNAGVCINNYSPCSFNELVRNNNAFNMQYS